MRTAPFSSGLNATWGARPDASCVGLCLARAGVALGFRSAFRTAIRHSTGARSGRSAGVSFRRVLGDALGHGRAPVVALGSRVLGALRLVFSLRTATAPGGPLLPGAGA